MPAWPSNLLRTNIIRHVLEGKTPTRLEIEETLVFDMPDRRWNSLALPSSPGGKAASFFLALHPSADDRPTGITIVHEGANRCFSVHLSNGKAVWPNFHLAINRIAQTCCWLTDWSQTSCFQAVCSPCENPGRIKGQNVRLAFNTWPEIGVRFRKLFQNDDGGIRSRKSTEVIMPRR